METGEYIYNTSDRRRARFDMTEGTLQVFPSRNWQPNVRMSKVHKQTNNIYMTCKWEIGKMIHLTHNLKKSKWKQVYNIISLRLLKMQIFQHT